MGQYSVYNSEIKLKTIKTFQFSCWYSLQHVPSEEDVSRKELYANSIPIRSATRRNAPTSGLVSQWMPYINYIIHITNIQNQ